MSNTPSLESIDADQTALKELQRAIAAVDIARDILVAGLPAYIAPGHYPAMDAAADLIAALRDMQRAILARLPEGPREYSSMGSRIGADSLRNL